jgi:hypothetical protein
MAFQSETGVEHSSYIKIHTDAKFKSHINGGGDFELNFDGVVDLSLTPDVAVKVYRMLGEALPDLRELSETEPAG